MEIDARVEGLLANLAQSLTAFGEILRALQYADAGRRERVMTRSWQRWLAYSTRWVDEEIGERDRAWRDWLRHSLTRKRRPRAYRGVLREHEPRAYWPSGPARANLDVWRKRRGDAGR
jgi:hypothetical protein